MTPDQIELVEESFQLLLSDSDALADAFYRRIFEQWPGLRPMFTGDIAVQRRKFIATLSTVVHALWRPDTVMPLLGELGARHVGYGVEPVHYELVGTALLDALRDQLGPAATPAVLDSWLAAYTIIADAMQVQAAQLDK